MTDSALRLALRLLKNGVRYRFQHIAGKPGMPQALSLEVTHDCIARCIMCNIWKIPDTVPNLSIPEWRELLSSGLFSDLRELDVTGGEPFIREDLTDLFDAICELKQKNLRFLQSIAITTNGLLTDRVLKATEKILPALRKEGLDLVVVVAMDAVGELHNRIRNYKHAGSKVRKTIEDLCKLKEAHPNMIVGLKTTILPLNINELSRILAFAESRGLFIIISPCIMTEGRYLNLDRTENLAFSHEDIEKMIAFFSSDQFRWSFHAESLIDFLKTGVMKKPCSCGFNYLFVRSNGELFLCPLIKESVGKVTTADVSELFFSSKANAIRKKIGKFPQCRTCTEPGLERYALPYEGFRYLKLFLKSDRDEFRQLHEHIGLNKFL